jgi:hypothetical protein
MPQITVQSPFSAMKGIHLRLMASLKQKITALEEQVTELHLVVYDRQDDFGVLRKATMSMLKRFTKSLGNPSLYNAPSP